MPVTVATSPPVSPLRRVEKPRDAVSSISQSWTMIAKKKKNDREYNLAKFPNWRLEGTVPSSVSDVTELQANQLSPKEHSIVHHDATSLLQLIHERHLTCTEVMKAYCHAAAVAQDTTNCLTEVFFDEGLTRAKELDEYLERTGKIVGPLHGLPVSIKDHIMVKNKDTSSGYISWCYNSVAKDDAVAVDILRKAGAILYVKTNNPQTLLSLETDNNIYGRTCNPFNTGLTSGGSSGGESALISSFGSPLGIGTDIGGSIRAPAAHCGLYGLKPSVGRMPHAGLCGSHDGMEAIIGALGPIARSARDLSLFCRVMLQYEPWLVEPPLLQIPWKQDVVDSSTASTKRTFAILWDDGVVKPHPPILDALRKAKDSLLSAGHNVIDWIPYDHQRAWDLISKLYFLDGGEEYQEVFMKSGEPRVPQTEWIMSHVPNGGLPYTVRETFERNKEREIFRSNLAKLWNDTQTMTGTGRPVDAIISPVAPTLAPRHDATRWWGYTSYWNLADYPGVVFPTGRYNDQSNASNGFTSTSGQTNGASRRSEIAQFVANEWDAATYQGVPVSLQLIGRRLNEEHLLAMLNVVERAMGNQED